MNVILSENLHDQAYIDARVDPTSFAALKAVVSQAKYTPENTEHVTGVPAAKVRKAAALLGAPKDVDPLREGRDLVGHPERRRDQHLRQPRAAARLRRAARPGVRPPGRPPERLHVRLRLGPPAGRRPAPQPLAGARRGARSTCSSSGSRTPYGCSSSRPSCASSPRRSRSSSTSTSARRTSARSPTSCCPRRRVGRVHVHAREPRAAPARQPAVLRPARRGRPRIPDLRPHRPEDRRQVRHPRPRRSGSTPPGRTSSTACAQTSEAKGRRHRPGHARRSSRRSAPTASRSRSSARATP